eukprot:gene27764-34532_t
MVVNGLDRQRKLKAEKIVLDTSLFVQTKAVETYCELCDCNVGLSKIETHSEVCSG